MADIFTSSYGELTTVMSNYYTSPSATKSIVTLIQTANKGSSDMSVSVAISASAGLYYIANKIVVPSGASVGLLTGKLILNSDEYIYASASQTSSVDIIISAVQQS